MVHFTHICVYQVTQCTAVNHSHPEGGWARRDPAKRSCDVGVSAAPLRPSSCPGSYWGCFLLCLFPTLILRLPSGYKGLFLNTVPSRR